MLITGVTASSSTVCQRKRNQAVIHMRTAWCHWEGSQLLPRLRVEE